jgi:hypothetical protein
MGHFWVNFFCKNLDTSYQHIYLGHPLKLKRVWAYIILGDFTGATPSRKTSQAGGIGAAASIVMG